MIVTIEHPRARDARVMLGDIDITDENYIEVDTDTGRCIRYGKHPVKTDTGELQIEEVLIPGIQVIFAEPQP